MKNQPRATIVILNYKGLKDTLECLESVKKCTYPHFEVILLDNGSGEDQVKKMREIRMENLRFVDNKENLGFAGGNNVAIKMVIEEKKSKYIYFLNNDTVVEPDFLGKAIETAEKDEKIGIIAGLSLQYARRELIENAGHILLDCGDSSPRGRNLPKGKMNESKEILGACSANALYRVKTLEECGMYDEKFFLNYEDADLSLRCVLHGWKCVYEPNSVIYHKVNVSINKVRDYTFNLRSQQNQMKSYFYNVPFLVLVLNMPMVILRDIFVVGLDLLFWRWKIVKVFLHAKLLFLKNIRYHWKMRGKRMEGKKISSWYIFKKQKSFIPVYFRFFVDIIWKRNKSTLEY